MKSTWPGRVDDVHAHLDAFEHLVDALFRLLHPGAGRRGGGDRDAALAFLLHPVGHGGAFVHLTDLVDHAGVKKDALGQRRLAGVDVRGNADVPRPLERELRGPANSDWSDWAFASSVADMDRQVAFTASRSQTASCGDLSSSVLLCAVRT